MHDSAASFLSPWANFYVIAGSAAGGLTGLMFVVVTLMAERRLRDAGPGISTFSTPTIVHFGAALLVAVILSAPWRLLIHPALLTGVAGATGVGYIVVVTVRLKRQTVYNPQPDDWLWYSLLPLIAYVTVATAAALLSAAPVAALFVLAAGTLLLIFIGIRNAWDIVTFLAMDLIDRPPDSLQG